MNSLPQVDECTQTYRALFRETSVTHTHTCLHLSIFPFVAGDARGRQILRLLGYLSLQRGLEYSSVSSNTNDTFIMSVCLAIVSAQIADTRFDFFRHFLVQQVDNLFKVRWYYSSNKCLSLKRS